MNIYNYDTLVLSGASSKGLLMIGALQSAYDKNIIENIKNYIGVSAGAIICFLLIIGYTPVEIFVHICTSRIMEKMKNLDIHSLLQNKGALPFKILENEIEKMIINKLGFIPTMKQIRELFGKNFICGTYNYTKKRVEFMCDKEYPELDSFKTIVNMENESCLVLLRMTSNLPFIFENFIYKEQIYLDGGVADNFPIDIGERLGNQIIGITIETEDKNSDNLFDFISTLIFVPYYLYMSEKTKNITKCDIIKLKSDLSFFNFNMEPKMKLELFSEGYTIMDKYIQ